MYLTRQKTQDSEQGNSWGKKREPNTRLVFIQLTIPGCSLKLNNSKLRIGCCPETS